MARFVFWSDLHMEFATFEPPHPDSFAGPIDGVLLAGDTASGYDLAYLDFAELVSSRYQVPVAMVLGNHEFYGCEVGDLLARQAQRLEDLRNNGHQIHILDGNAVVIAGTRIVGATLWTDFELDPVAPLNSRQIAEAMMNDYRAIKIDDGGIRPLQVTDTITFHRSEKNALLTELSQPFNGRVW